MLTLRKRERTKTGRKEGREGKEGRYAVYMLV